MVIDIPQYNVGEIIVSFPYGSVRILFSLCLMHLFHWDKGS